MYAILAASIAALAIFIERLWSLRVQKVMPHALTERVIKLIMEDKHSAAQELCNASTNPLAKLYAKVFQRRNDPMPLVKESLEEEGRQQAAQLEKYTSGLALIASISPLLGLLGTVLGMISAFQRVSHSGYSSPMDLAAGVWEALLTTAFGLIVGIPALLAYHFILGKVDRTILRLEEETTRLVDLIHIETASSSK
jgi:biopolymer transport protein ExbB